MDYTEYNNALFENLVNEKNKILLSPMRETSRSIFGISDSNDKTYSAILSAFERCTLVWFEGITVALCNHYSLKCVIEPAFADTRGDICITKNNVRYNVFFQSNIVANASRIRDRLKNIAEPCKFVILLDDSISSQRVIESFKETVKSITEKDIDVLNFTDFIRFFFGEKEVESSLDNVNYIKTKMRSLVGQKITAICTDEQKQSFLEQMDSMITELDYDELVDSYDNSAPDERPYPNDFDEIRNNYIDKKRYSIMLKDRDFAESFFTAEWLYVNYPGSEELDNTYVVSGYLKSIEQLLWAIIFIIGKGKRIGNGRHSATINDDDSIYTTLGDFGVFLNNYRNDNSLCASNIDMNHSKVVLDYLRFKIDDFREKHRNGYFHKDNLDTRRVQDIRMKTLLLYYLILGTLNITDEIAERLSQ